MLDRVLHTRWDVGALHIGTSANAAVWWSCNGETVSVCIGHDDQTWDFSIAFAASEFARMRQSIETAVRDTGR